MHNNNSRKNLDIITIMDMLAEYMLPRDMRDDFDFLLINHVGIDSINRLSAQNEPDNEAIARLRKYVKHYIPKFSSSNAFKEEGIKRRVVCWLNCNGFHVLSHKLFELKLCAGRVIGAQ